MARSGTIRQIINSDEKESICRLILSDIPEWLRHGENIDDYAAACRAIPFWADAEDDEVRGFISLRAFLRTCRRQRRNRGGHFAPP